MAQHQENNSSLTSTEGPVRYGELTVLGCNDVLPNGDEARTKSHFTLYQRPRANGLKPSTVHRDCNPHEAKAISVSDAQHSVSYSHSAISTTVVEYAPDKNTDMFQIGRATESPDDFVVTDTDTVSRFACRIVCQRSPPYAARIYAAGFDSSKKIFLGVKAVKWNTRNGQMDGLTTNGVLVLHPPHVLIQEPGLWREISVCGNVFTLRKTCADRGEMVDSESHELVDGSLIDLCGVTLLWRTAEGLARTPTMEHLEIQRGPELYHGRPCFVYNVLKVDSSYAGLLTSDAEDYEADSWCLAVESGFSKEQDPREVKRQNVIYELMKTERQHLETLVVMAAVFRGGLRDEVRLDAEALERLFPRLDQLVLFHHAFFSAMKERRHSSISPPPGHSSTQPPGHSSTQPPGHANYLIQHIGDVLLKQFSDENAQRMKQAYGEFCSRHKEAVGFYRLKLNNKDFQDFIKQQSSKSLVQRREIPDCLLLVTQRITKYPLLLEKILQYTQEDTEEHAHMVRALAHVREAIAAVDLRVSEYEQDRPLRDVLNRMENHSSATLKDGLAFRKQDLAAQRHKHQGRLLVKTASGRLNDVLVLLLSDTLIFLQENNQKFTFATVDEKPPVISLQKLRAVANEERGMYLISESGARTHNVLYEVLAPAQDERNTWIRLIREAMERKDRQSSQNQDC